MSLLAFLAIAVAGQEALARPRVSVTVDVRLPYTQRWSDRGLLVPLQDRIAETLILYLTQFRYLEWAYGGSGAARLHVVVEAHPRARGAKPWILRITRTDLPETPEFPLPLASAVMVQGIARDERLSADQLALWVDGALQALENDEVAKRFVSTVLVRIAVANKVAPNLPNVFVNVPAAKLHATDRTRLAATLLVTRDRELPLQYPMTLAFIGAPIAPAFKDSHTECRVTSPGMVAEYRPFVAIAPAATISVSEYYPNWGPLRNQNTMQRRKR